jgi:hypothetical protein
MGTVGLGNKYQCFGEGQQQFISQNVCLAVYKLAMRVAAIKNMNTEADDNKYLGTLTLQRLKMTNWEELLCAVVRSH